MKFGNFLFCKADMREVYKCKWPIIQRRKTENGGAKRDRTADLLRARQALSQLSYSPK